MKRYTHSDIVLNTTAHMERAVALSAAAEHATALRTIAETALPVPPPFGDMKVVDVVAAVWILKEN